MLLCFLPSVFLEENVADSNPGLLLVLIHASGKQIGRERRDAIRAVFYVNQLQLQQGPQMTATEVIQRNEEKMRLLGPVLGRLQSELLKPLIDRAFNILLRKNMFTPAPEFLAGKDIEIEYVSPLAKAH